MLYVFIVLCYVLLSPELQLDSICFIYLFIFLPSWTSTIDQFIIFLFCFYPLWLTGECSASSDLVGRGRRVGGAWWRGQINKSDSRPPNPSLPHQESKFRAAFHLWEAHQGEPLIGSSGTTGGVRPSTDTHTRTHSLALAQLQLHVKVWTQSFAAAQFIFLFSFLFCSSSVRSAWPPLLLT